MKAIIWCVTGVHVFCSISMLWDKLPQFVHKLQCQVIPNRANGFCFLHAVCMTVCMDHDNEMTLGKLQSSILDHMAANVNYYKQFHTGNVLKDMKRYFKFGTYCDSVVDLIVVATPRALNMNLKIYQKGTSGNIQILEHIAHATVRKPTWNLHMTIVIWLTTTMKPYCSLMNLHQGIQMNRSP